MSRRARRIANCNSASSILHLADPHHLLIPLSFIFLFSSSAGERTLHRGEYRPGAAVRRRCEEREAIRVYFTRVDET